MLWNTGRRCCLLAGPTLCTLGATAECTLPHHVRCCIGTVATADSSVIILQHIRATAHSHQPDKGVAQPSATSTPTSLAGIWPFPRLMSWPGPSRGGGHPCGVGTAPDPPNGASSGGSSRGSSQQQQPTAAQAGNVAAAGRHRSPSPCCCDPCSVLRCCQGAWLGTPCWGGTSCSIRGAPLLCMCKQQKEVSGRGCCAQVGVHTGNSLVVIVHQSHKPESAAASNTNSIVLYRLLSG